MSKRIVGVKTDTGEEVPIGSDRLLLSSSDHAAPGHQMRLEHVLFETLDKPHLTVSDPYVALVIGEPLVYWKEEGSWRLHRFRSGQLSIKNCGPFGPFQSKDRCQVVLVSINANVFSDMSLQMELPSHTVLADNITADSDFLKAMVVAYRDEVQSGFPGGRILHDSIQTSLVCHLLTYHSNWRTRDQASRCVRGGLSPQTLKRVFDYMVENLASEISLSDLAQVAFLSVYHFSRMFKVSTGYSPYNYLSHLRVHRAATMMRNGVRDVNQVAKAAGFQDGRALSRQFKRVIGESTGSFLKDLE